MEEFELIWNGLVKPLARLLLSMSVGVLVANLLEALSWERYMARLAAPLVRLARMGEAAGASFVLSFFSAHSAANILTEAYAEKRIGKKELVLSNLFNSLPAYLVHLPGVAAIAIAFLGRWGVVYIALGLAGALLRTLGTALAGHFLLPPLPAEGRGIQQPARKSWAEIRARVLRSFRKRLLKVIKFTVPIYALFFLINHLGGFRAVQDFMAEHLSFMSFLRPEALSLVALGLAAETSASMSAAAYLLQAACISGHEIVIALTIGNILSSPVRAFRHQLPVYAGYFPGGVALLLIACNQAVRALSLLVVLILYYNILFTG